MPLSVLKKITKKFNIIFVNEQFDDVDKRVKIFLPSNFTQIVNAFFW